MNTFSRTFLVLVLAVASQTGNAQTLTTNPENWNTLVSGNCSSCTITIPSGYVLNLNTGNSCSGCTFVNHGTINVTNSFDFTNSTINGGILNFTSAPKSSVTPTITNATINVNAATTFSTAILTNDTIKVNSNLTFTNSSSTVTGSHITIATGLTVNANTLTFTDSYVSIAGTTTFNGNNALTLDNSTFYLGGTSANITDNNTTTIKNGSNVILAGSGNTFAAKNLATVVNSNISATVNGKITATSLTMQGGSLTLNDNATFTSSNAISLGNTSGTTVSLSVNSDLTGTDMTIANNSHINLIDNAFMTGKNSFNVSSSAITLGGNAYIGTLTGGNVALTNSTIIVGDGSQGSTAHIHSHAAMSMDASSLVTLYNWNNYYVADAGTVAGNTLNCKPTNPTYPNSCNTLTVYGCATIKNTSTAACTLLAAADINLSLANAGANTVNLTFTDEAAASADHYLVQRSNDNSDWITIATVNAGGYSTGIYHYTDAGAPIGEVVYRIGSVDQNGHTSWSPVSSITVIGKQSQIGLHPNPATGGMFYISTTSTEQLIVNVYTITGQLLLRTAVQGQTQYPIHLSTQAVSGGAVVVQVVAQGESQTFTLLVR